MTPKGELSKGSLPSWLEEPLISRLLNLKLASHDDHTQGVFGNSPHQRPNHVLINEYPPGIGIFPHEDGPAYFPAVATISLGGHTVLDVYRKDAIGQREMQPTWRILQERRSLLITMGDLYRETLHGIGDLVSDDNLGSGRIDNWEMLRDDTRSACVSNNGALERRLRISATIRDVIQVRDYSKLLSGRGGKRM